MINLQLNNLCPLCNTTIFVGNKLASKYKRYYCDNCPDRYRISSVHLYYNNNDTLDKLYICLNNNTYVNIHFDLNVIRYDINKISIEYYELPIQNFNSIKDLLDIVNIHVLFQ